MPARRGPVMRFGGRIGVELSGPQGRELRPWSLEVAVGALWLPSSKAEFSAEKVAR
jgi:hypothetical protein